jgi:hypothetical protein
LVSLLEDGLCIQAVHIYLFCYFFIALEFRVDHLLRVHHIILVACAHVTCHLGELVLDPALIDPPGVCVREPALIVRESMPFFIVCMEDVCLDDGVDGHVQSVGDGDFVVIEGCKDDPFVELLVDNLEPFHKVPHLRHVVSGLL